MAEFRVTFGARYRYEQHPLGWPHPDGWLSVEADSYEVARGAVQGWMGDRFAFMYEEGDSRFPAEDTYPSGELMKLIISTELADIVEEQDE